MAIIEFINSLEQYTNGSVNTQLLAKISNRHDCLSSPIISEIYTTTIYKLIISKGYVLKNLTIINNNEIISSMELVPEGNPQEQLDISLKQDFEKKLRSIIAKSIQLSGEILKRVDDLHGKGRKQKIEQLCQAACGYIEEGKAISKLMRAYTNTNYAENDTIRIETDKGFDHYLMKKEIGWIKSIEEIKQVTMTLVGQISYVDDVHQRILFRPVKDKNKWYLYCDTENRNTSLKIQTAWQKAVVTLSCYITKWDGNHVAKEYYQLEMYNENKHADLVSAEGQNMDLFNQ